VLSSNVRLLGFFWSWLIQMLCVVARAQLLRRAIMIDDRGSDR
jgi:hypothetical protein